MATMRPLTLLGLLWLWPWCPAVVSQPSLEDNVPGLPGEDYPTLASPPATSFSCADKVAGGYYADTEAGCQAFHICVGDGAGGLTKYSFLCPNGTLFNQQYFVCDWWFNVDCDRTEHFYSLNEELHTARQSAVHSTTQDINKIIDDEPSAGVGRGSGLRQAPGQRRDDRLSNQVETVLTYETEIPAYKRPSRDLQFNYVNTAKKEAERFEDFRDEPSAEEILESLMRLVSPEDLDDLYIR